MEGSFIVNGLYATLEGWLKPFTKIWKNSLKVPLKKKLTFKKNLAKMSVEFQKFSNSLIVNISCPKIHVWCKCDQSPFRDLDDIEKYIHF